MQRTNIYLADDQIAALDEMASARGVSRAQIVRAFIEHGRSGTQGLDNDLLAIEESFGALRNEQSAEYTLDRDTGEREQHLERIPAL